MPTMDIFGIFEATLHIVRHRNTCRVYIVSNVIMGECEEEKG